MATTEQNAWIGRVLGVGLGGEISARQTAPADVAGSKGMAAWQVARGTALASLKALEDAFRKMQEPEVDEAIILLRAIRANLTEAPTTPAQVKELEDYLKNDRIIREAETPNGFGFKVSLRDPLLGALAGLQQDQGTVGEQPR